MGDEGGISGGKGERPLHSAEFVDNVWLGYVSPATSCMGAAPENQETGMAGVQGLTRPHRGAVPGQCLVQGTGQCLCGQHTKKLQLFGKSIVFP